MQALSLCEDSGKKDALYALGGQAVLSIGDWANVSKRTCYVYLRLPHSSPALSGSALPFPSDVLTAPIQIQIDLADFSSYFSAVTVAGTAADPIPASFSSAVVNFTQVTMQDSGDLVARKFDMSKHALTIPLAEGWTQEEVQFPFTSGADGSFQLSLTGCKAGDLRMLRVWFTKPSNTGGLGSVQNQSLYIPPAQIVFAINGLNYFDSNNGSWVLTNLLRRRQPALTTYSVLTAPVAAPGAYTVTPTASQWVEINLAQPYTIGNSCEVSLVHGVPVMNSVMNLTGLMPQAATSFVCHVEYVLNCSWMASRGSAEFVF